MPELHIRRYLPSDQEAVWRLHVLASQEQGVYSGSGYWDQDIREIEQSYLSLNGDFLTGWLGDRLVTMGGLLPWPGHRAEVKRLQVHPEFWPQGYGKIMLAALEQRAGELGYHTIHIEASSIQLRIRHLLERCGFANVGQIERSDAILLIYEKLLNSD
ncbi:MAG: GNAT family N-acetyltransferase [Chloroflexi bacterium]|nr:GNAT family N-acetyltransferase [Chloroflexota bacterium]